MLFLHCEDGGGPRLRFFLSCGARLSSCLMHRKTLLSGLSWFLEKNKIPARSQRNSKTDWLRAVSPGSTFLFRLFHLYVRPSFSSFVSPFPFPSAVFSPVFSRTASLLEYQYVFLTMSLWKQIMSVEKTLCPGTFTFLIGGIYSFGRKTFCEDVLKKEPSSALVHTHWFGPHHRLVLKNICNWPK